MVDLPANPTAEDLKDVLREEGGKDKLTAILTERPELRALTDSDGVNIVDYAELRSKFPPVTPTPPEPSPDHSHDHSAPLRRTPTLAEALRDYGSGGRLGVISENGPDNMAAISSAIRSDANSADKGSYFTLVREGDRQLVVTGNRTRGLNGRYETTGVYEVKGEGKDAILVPVTNAAVKPNMSFEIALDGQPYMNDPEHPSRPVGTTVATTTPAPAGPSTGAPATPSTRVAAGPSAAAPSGPAPSQARQNWDATVATIRQSINKGVSPTTGTEVADALRNFANNPVNNLQGTNKDAMLTAANNIQKMSPDQIQGMLSQPAGRSGKTVEQALTSNNPRDNSVAVTSLMRQSLRGGPALANGQQPAQPRVGFNDPSQNYMNGLRSGNAQEAGTALQQLAEQQQLMANATRNPNLANTARINMEAAQVLQGPNGQQALEQQLSRQVGSGKTVRDMLDSPNQNAQMAAGAFVANSNSRSGQQYNRNTMPAMQLAARMETRLGGNALAANHGNNHGVNGGHDAHDPAGPAGGPGGARRGGAGAGVGA